MDCPSIWGIPTKCLGVNVEVSNNCLNLYSSAAREHLRRLTRQILATVIALCVGAGCSRRAVETVHGVPLAPSVRCASSDCRTYNVLPYVLTRSKYGVGCLGNVPPGSMPNQEPPPQSYSAEDIGKPGMRQLTAGEASMLQRIRHYVHSKTLRVAWVDGATTPGGFIVFDATDGPCYGNPGGYSVLNGTCNEGYQPGETPYHTIAESGCFQSPRPWLTRHHVR